MVWQCTYMKMHYSIFNLTMTCRCSAFEFLAELRSCRSLNSEVNISHMYILCGVWRCAPCLNSESVVTVNVQRSFIIVIYKTIIYILCIFGEWWAAERFISFLASCLTLLLLATARQKSRLTRLVPYSRTWLWIYSLSIIEVLKIITEGVEDFFLESIAVWIVNSCEFILYDYNTK